MKPLVVCVALSVGVHAGAAVWFGALTDAGGSGSERIVKRANFAVASSAAVARLVETWEAQPEVGAAPRPLSDNAVPTRPTAPTPVQPTVAKTTPAFASLPTSGLLPRQPANHVYMALPLADADGPKDPVAPNVHGDRIEIVEGDRPARLADRPAAPTPVETSPAAFTQPDHPGPELLRSAPPVPRPSQTAARPPATQASINSVARAPDTATSGRAPSVAPPGARASWGNEIRQSIARHHRVPDAALRRGLSGRVVLRVTVRPDGGVTGMAVLAGSGHAILDRAAVSTLRRAGRLPPAPQGVTSAMTFDVPLTFRTG